MLPPPEDAAAAHHLRVVQAIASEIAAAGGWISFARYMDMALYAPGLGYYSAGARKLGADGDFVTAPELGPLFGRTLARSAAEVLAHTGGDILEFGAGSGRLACQLLGALAESGRLPARYYILETSADLRARQRELLAEELPHLLPRVTWLDALPAAHVGLMLGNEVLDAMPVHLVRTRPDNAAAIDELGVVVAEAAAENPRFTWETRPAQGALLEAARALALPPGHTTEIGLAARAFMRGMAASLKRGVALFLDYGFPAAEYYHPQRDRGTLMCHYRHRAHDDPLLLAGLQDITAHVDFSAVARAAAEGGLDLLGYCTQARFLINSGITADLEKIPAENARAYLPAAAEAQRLLSPAEMGELFKAIAFGRDYAQPLAGFASGDRRGTLV